MNGLPGVFKWLQRIRKTKTRQEAGTESEAYKENPYLPYIREILKQVLKKRGLDYGRMRLLIIDTDLETGEIFWEDAVLSALEDLSPDLNFLTIFTNRAAYFQEYAETMYEEHGLLVCLEEKQNQTLGSANTVLDFERQGRFWQPDLPEPSIYLPIYKKEWERAENLDIFVPIGYNTVTVEGIPAVEKRGRML